MKTENGLKNEQLKMAKSYNETAEAKKAILEGRGIVQAQELYKSGEPLTAGATSLNQEQQKDFARYAKSFGMTYALIENGSGTGKLILFPEKDLQKVPMDFDRALNHITERDWYVSSEPYYVVERSNPAHYIELSSQREKDHRGQEYTKTYYSVYADGEKVADLHDGRFAGRTRGY